MKITKKIVKGALALGLCASISVPMVATTFAAEPAKKELKIKKVLTLPDNGVTTPTPEFTFTIDKVSYNNDDKQKDDLPIIAQKDGRKYRLIYSASDNTDGDSKTSGKQIIKVTDDLLSNVTFTKAGQYTYRITEDSASNTNDEEYTCSQASYLVSIFVIEKDKKFVVENIQIKQEKGDNGKPIKDAKKTPYTHGTGNNLDGNNFIFNNTYNKKAGNDKPGNQNGGNGTGGKIDDADKKGFAILKTLKDSSSQEKFTFSLTITKPVTVTGNNLTYTVKIVDSKGAIINTLTLNYDAKQELKLSAGEKAVLSNVYLGSKVKVEETGKGAYTPSIKEGQINGTTVTLENLKKGELVLGDNASGNFANFVNTPMSATGVLLANLPIIVLIAIGVGGIIFFAKNKKKEERQY